MDGGVLAVGLLAVVVGGAVLLRDFARKVMNRVFVNNFSVKSKSAARGAIEMNIEVRLKEDDTDFINILSEMPGINSAVIVSYNGDYMG